MITFLRPTRLRRYVLANDMPVPFISGWRLDGTRGGIRTLNTQVLNLLSLPVGLLVRVAGAESPQTTPRWSGTGESNSVPLIPQISILPMD